MLASPPYRRTGPALARAVALLLFAVAVVTGASAAPARAAGGDVTWTVRTAGNDFGDDRSSFAYGVNPGSTTKDAMVVTNGGATPLTLAVYASDGYTTDKGQLDLLTREKESKAVGAWVRPARDSVTVAPGKSAEVPFTVTVPRGAAPGDHVGGLLTSLKQADDTEGIAVDRRLGIRVEVRVSGALRPSLAVEDVHLGYDGSANPFARGRATVTYTLHNTGNALLSGTQQVSLSGPFGLFEASAGEIATPPELLPGERWTVTVPVRDVTPALRLTAAVAVTPLVTDAAGSTTSLEPVRVTGHGWAVPWTLLVVVFLLVAGGVAAFVRGRRARARRARREDERVREAVERALRDEAGSSAGR
ncbi:WxL protein peptidoglycan domain-containing protein [uncultured Streptomyces sp.]|uniref:WxL protein peptidoglycan domain-containing protein n=1 Tax=uncultured Streptomyces sp. TaxID=174707 RepID=UPI002633FD57|nr:DUF916 domain-containing protein [uncultured Streptomyces sp.]